MGSGDMESNICLHEQQIYKSLGRETSVIILRVSVFLGD